ncbi:MAG TPA: LysR family transcriptional regulator [Nocardioidaceae bacterium]|jgi:molybdate transport repressor ModE-like protein
MLDVHRLDVLQRFAAHGSIAGAAAELGCSPSAVSQQLATLEREAGLPLIERTSRTASLTDAGRELVEHASIILSAVETAQTRMRARMGVIAGRVRVSFIPGLAATVAPDLAELQRRHPALTVVALQIESTAAPTALLDRATDVAVIDEWGEESVASSTALRVHRAHREPIVLAVPAEHPIAHSHHAKPVSATTLRDLVAHETWLSTPAGQVSRLAGDARLTAIGATPSRRWQFDGLYVLARLVAVGSGIALLPSSIAAYERKVAAIPLRPPMYRYVRILTRSTTQDDPAIAACVKAVRQALTRRPARGT